MGELLIERQFIFFMAFNFCYGKDSRLRLCARGCSFSRVKSLSKILEISLSISGGMGEFKRMAEKERCSAASLRLTILWELGSFCFSKVINYELHQKD